MSANLHTVKSLREAGYKVRVFHDRILSKKSLECVGMHIDFFGNQEAVFAYRAATPTGNPRFVEKGGRTQVDILTPGGKSLTGESLCSKHDNYSRKEGVRIALLRAFGLPTRETKKEAETRQLEENLLAVTEEEQKPLVRRINAYQH